MPRDITITFDDGTNHVYQNAPDEVTPEQVHARASKEFANKKITALDGGRKAEAKKEEKPKEPGYLENISNKVGAAASEVAKNPVKGVAGIYESALAAGSSMVAPVVATIAKDIGHGQDYKDEIYNPKLKPEERVALFQKRQKESEERYHKIKESLTYQPKTEAGKAISEVPGAVTKPVGDLVSRGATAVAHTAGGDQTSGEELGDLINFGLTAAGVKGAKGQLVKKPLGVEQALVDAQKHGYTISAAKANPTAFNKLAEGLSGKARIDEAASVKNQPVTERLVRKGLGMGDDVPINADSLRDVRTDASQAYENLKNIENKIVKPNQNFWNEVDKIAKTKENPKAGEPGFNRGKEIHPITKFTNLIKTARENGFTIDHAIEMTKELREEADKAYRAGDKSVGKAAKTLANQIERSIEQHLEKNVPGAAGQKLLADFRGARERIAKTYTVQKALDGVTGLVDARKLAKELVKNPGKLKGELESVAKFAEANKEQAAPKTAAPAATISDLVIGKILAGGAGTGLSAHALGAGLGSSGVTAGAAVVAMVARPAMRAFLNSKLHQAGYRISKLKVGGGGKALDAAEAVARKTSQVRRRGSALTAAELARQED